MIRRIFSAAIAFILLLSLFSPASAEGSCALSSGEAERVTEWRARAEEKEGPSADEDPIVGNRFLFVIWEEDGSLVTSLPGDGAAYDFGAVPPEKLAASFDEADTVILLYPHYRVVGHYGDSFVPGVKTSVMLCAADTVRDSVSQPYAAAAEDPPDTAVIRWNQGVPVKQEYRGKYLPQHAIEAAAAKLRDRPAPRPAAKTVTFGRWPQNADGTDLTPIEWIVLEERDGRALLLSRYLLDAQPFCVGFANTWEESDLRAWLNGAFAEGAFTPEEAAAILTVTVDNSEAQNFPDSLSWGGLDTEDRIFLLSYHEAAEVYFASDEERFCAPTDYAAAAGVSSTRDFMTEGRRTGFWWLRSPGGNTAIGAAVRCDGVCMDSFDVAAGWIGVRPALWAELSGI